jgi:glycosyltransferase 2 family protein
MPMPRTNTLVRFLGATLGLLGLIFVGRKLAGESGQLFAQGVGAATVVWLIAAILLHALGGMLLGEAWENILRHLSVRVSRGWAIATFGVSQMARYVPGNIFQYVGRQALGAAAGINAAVLIKSSLWELAGLILVSALLGGLYWLVVFKHVSSGAATGIFLLVLVAVWAATRRLGGRHLGRAIAFHSIYLVITGAVFAGFLVTHRSAQSGWNSSGVIGFIGAYVLAWLGGLVTPGAPAGIGVREAALYGLLHHSVGRGELLSAMLLSRVANVTGDVLLYCWAVWYRSAFRPS